MPNNQIVTYQPSSNTALSVSLMGIRTALHNAALVNVAQAGDGFTEAEKVAMTTIEELKLVNGMDLAAMLLRYELICTIRNQSLWSVHPGQYQSFEDMARQQGISISELSNIMDLCGTIFPFLETELGISVAVIWDRIGKSNFRELVPILKSIITGEASDTQSTRGSVEQIMNDVAATAAAAGQTLTEEEERNQAINNILEVGTLTNREMRQRIRHDRTASIQSTIVNSNGRRILLAELNEEQFTLIQRRLNGYMDANQVDFPRDLRTRQREAHRIPVLATLLQELEI
jgi:hypothetical protein